MINWPGALVSLIASRYEDIVMGEYELDSIAKDYTVKGKPINREEVSITFTVLSAKWYRHRCPNIDWNGIDEFFDKTDPAINAIKYERN